MGLDRIDREVKQGGDLFQGLVQHVLEDDHAPLHGRKLHEPRHRRLDRFPPHQRLHRVRAFRIGDLVSRLDRLGRADRFGAHEVQRPVVGDPEQPRPQRRRLLQLVQCDKGAGEGVLHHVLAVDHRAHQAGCVTVKLRPELGGERQEIGATRGRRRGWASVQAASPSRTVMPYRP